MIAEQLSRTLMRLNVDDFRDKELIARTEGSQFIAARHGFLIVTHDDCGRSIWIEWQGSPTLWRLGQSRKGPPAVTRGLDRLSESLFATVVPALFPKVLQGPISFGDKAM